MKRLICHIGLAKTGTTALQHGLATLGPALRERGVAVLVDAPGAPDEPEQLSSFSKGVLTLFDPNTPGIKRKQASAFKFGRLLSRSDDSRRGHEAVQAAADAALRSWFERYDTLVLSAESLEPVRERSGAWPLLQRWSERAQVSVVALVRPQWDLVLSKWSQAGWARGYDDLTEFLKRCHDAITFDFAHWKDLLTQQMPNVEVRVLPYRGYLANEVAGLVELLQLLPSETTSGLPSGLSVPLVNPSWPLEAMPALSAMARGLGADAAQQTETQDNIRRARTRCPLGP